MENNNRNSSIRVAIAGVGNCASSLIEGLNYYRQDPDLNDGLLFPILGGYSIRQIDIVAAFDISARKVGQTICHAIYQAPNNFVRIPGVKIAEDVIVQRGPTLDGNPPHLAVLVPESPDSPIDVSQSLISSGVEVLVNLLPTGSVEASAYYAKSALEAGCAFVNCIPAIIAQRSDFQQQFTDRRLPLLGDDIKSQLGTTILHRTLLKMLKLRGASLHKTSQVNIGGNTDFANFVHRAETKLVSKRKSLATYIGGAEFHVGHHYDVTRGPLKNAYIDIEASVFGGSPVKISVKLESDDKPNSAGSVVDLIRLARAGLDCGLAGPIEEACAFYFKSPPVEMDENIALDLIEQKWVNKTGLSE